MTGTSEEVGMWRSDRRGTYSCVQWKSHPEGLVVWTVRSRGKEEIKGESGRVD